MTPRKPGPSPWLPMTNTSSFISPSPTTGPTASRISLILHEIRRWGRSFFPGRANHPAQIFKRPKKRRGAIRKSCCRRFDLASGRHLLAHSLGSIPEAGAAIHDPRSGRDCRAVPRSRRALFWDLKGLPLLLTLSRHALGASLSHGKSASMTLSFHRNTNSSYSWRSRCRSGR